GAESLRIDALSAVFRPAWSNKPAEPGAGPTVSVIGFYESVGGFKGLVRSGGVPFRLLRPGVPGV
ncbi:MAG: hypothetical protein OEM15_19305, partial [Myxococcales bacterium]|nr:hypothetical protein [Myxococcales bacterium]